MSRLKLLFMAIIVIASAIFVASERRSYRNGMLCKNVEALMQNEDPRPKEDGALWASGNTYCCGPGNVRDCDEKDENGNLIYVPCKF